jgi:hypothetical protein
VSPAAWLRSRLPEPPVRLLQAAIQAVEATPEAPLPARLARAAVDRLAAALRLGDDRAAAFELLLADALLTWSCEAAAEAGEAALADLDTAWQPAAFSVLMAAAER